MYPSHKKLIKSSLLSNQILGAVLIGIYCLVYGLTAQVLLTGIQLVFFLSSLIFALSVFYVRDKESQKEIVLNFIKAGASINEQNGSGETLLMAAIKNDYGELVPLLLEQGADPNLLDKNGKSALDYARLSNNKFVEEIPSGKRYSNECKRYHLPLFPVTQSKPFKEDKVRLVYDASAKYKGTSLNDAFYLGPDLTNSLRGVLLRFRERPVAFCGDVESMFNAFKVPPHQCDMLRFFWPHQNDFKNELVEYRALSHVFGCTSSPCCGLIWPQIRSERYIIS